MDIDFVIPWVDGNDRAWLEEKKKYTPSTTNASNDIDNPNRYRDWDLLKYWFRGVETYAPWVRQIHFLTWGHTPSFLKLDHPKLHIVNHKDFIPLDALPTYSSLAIEMCLHNIKDLSEHFVYFNDDMFLTRPVEEKDFFIKGLPAEYFEEKPFTSTEPTIYTHWIHNALCIINRNFNKHNQIKKHLSKWFRFVSKKAFINTLQSYPWETYLGFPTSHLPAPFLKSTWTDLWKHEQDYLLQTVYSRFRGSSNVEQDLFRFWQFAKCTFENSIINGKFYSTQSTSAEEISRTIQKQTYKEICINDDCDDKTFNEYKEKITSAFEIILPNKSSFEK